MKQWVCHKMYHFGILDNLNTNSSGQTSLCTTLLRVIESIRNSVKFYCFHFLQWIIHFKGQGKINLENKFWTGNIFQISFLCFLYDIKCRNNVKANILLNLFRVYHAHTFLTFCCNLIVNHPYLWVNILMYEPVKSRIFVKIQNLQD